MSVALVRRGLECWARVERLEVFESVIRVWRRGRGRMGHLGKDGTHKADLVARNFARRRRSHTLVGTRRQRRPSPVAPPHITRFTTFAHAYVFLGLSSFPDAVKNPFDHNVRRLLSYC